MRKALALGLLAGTVSAVAQTPAPGPPFTPVTVTTGPLRVTGGSLANVPSPQPFKPVTVDTRPLTVKGGALPKPPQAAFKPMTLDTPALRVVGGPVTKKK